jgi:hypothetical protein
MPDAKGAMDWEEAFIDNTFAPSKKAENAVWQRAQML